MGRDIPQDYSNELDDRADWYVPMVAYDLYSAVLLLHAHPHRSWCQHGTRSYMLSLFLPVYLKIADLAVCLGLDATFHHKRCRRPYKRRRSGMALLYHVRDDMSRRF